jgi:hypothetical protein
MRNKTYFSNIMILLIDDQMYAQNYNKIEIIYANKLYIKKDVKHYRKIRSLFFKKNLEILCLHFFL